MNDIPSLDQCVVVDSRLSSRRQLLQGIKDCGLFLTVKEAESLEHGIEVVRYSETDACVFGPALSEQSIKEFIAIVEQGPASKDCAFIRATTDETVTDTDTPVFALPWPCNKLQLIQHLSTAVIRSAQAGSQAPDPRALQAQIERLEQGYFSFRTDGSPSATTERAIQALVDVLLAFEDPKRESLTIELYEWLKDRDSSSTKESRQALKLILARCLSTASN